MKIKMYNIAGYISFEVHFICQDSLSGIECFLNGRIIALNGSPRGTKKQAEYVHNSPGIRENAARFINKNPKKQYHRAFKANAAVPGVNCKAPGAIAKEFVANAKEFLAIDKDPRAIAKDVGANVQESLANDKLPRANAKDVEANVQELAANDKEFLAIAKDVLPNAGTPAANVKDVLAIDKTSAANAPGALANALDPVQNCESNVHHSMNLKEEKWNN